MKITLSYIFNNITPARDILLKLLRPSEIASICIAIGSTLTDNEKCEYMYPLREIFSSFQWIDTVFNVGGVAALHGDNIDNLCNPLCRQIKLWFFIFKPLYGSISDSDYNKEFIENECKPEGIYDDIEIRPITTTGYYPYVRDKRVVLLTCVIDDIRIFKLSFDSIYEIVKDKNNVLNIDRFSDLTYLKEIKLPYAIFKDNTMYKGITVFDFPCTLDVNFCNSCDNKQYIHPDFNLSYWEWGGNNTIENETLSYDMRWLFWVENLRCESHKAYKTSLRGISFPQ